MVVDAETAKLKKFEDFLSTDDKIAFHDMLLECRLYAPYAGVMASPVKELPLLISMLFGQHKRILDLEKKIVTFETLMKKSQQNSPISDAQQLPPGLTLSSRASDSLSASPE
jgi:hypothetical protein